MPRIEVESKWRDLFKEGRSVYTLILILGMTLYAMDAFTVATIMPTVVTSIGGEQFYAWVLMLYMTASIVGAASGGPLKLRLGTRGGFVTAGILFLLGTLVAGLSLSMPVMLVGRLVAGLGAGLIAAQCTALISEIFPASLRTRMIAAISTVWAASAIAGPLVGGVFAQLGFWRGAFFFSAAIIITFTIMAYRVLPKKPATEKPLSINFQIGRLTLLAISVLLIGTTGNVSTTYSQITLFSLGTVLLVLVVRLDSSIGKNGLLPSRAFSLKSPVGTALWILLLISTAPVAIGLYMPLAYQIIYGLSPIAAGYLGALLALFWTLGSVLSAGLRIAAQRTVLILGPTMASLGIMGVGLTIGQLPWFVIAGFTSLAGLGIGICIPHLMNWTMSLARKGEESITAASIQTVRSLGIALAAAIAGLIANNAGFSDGIDRDSVVRGISWIETAAALAPALAAAIGLNLIRYREHLPTAHKVE